MQMHDESRSLERAQASILFFRPGMCWLRNSGAIFTVSSTSSSIPLPGKDGSSSIQAPVNYKVAEQTWFVSGILCWQLFHLESNNLSFKPSLLSYNTSTTRLVRSRRGRRGEGLARGGGFTVRGDTITAECLKYDVIFCLLTVWQVMVKTIQHLMRGS